MKHRAAEQEAQALGVPGLLRVQGDGGQSARFVPKADVTGVYGDFPMVGRRAPVRRSRKILFQVAPELGEERTDSRQATPRAD
jgi:hypothetical protein